MSIVGHTSAISDIYKMYTFFLHSKLKMLPKFRQDAASGHCMAVRDPQRIAQPLVVKVHHEALRIAFPPERENLGTHF